MSIKITRASGFQMSFDNGFTVSVQIGTMNYHSNRYTEQSEWVKFDGDLINMADYKSGELGSPNAEIAILCNDEIMHDTVAGWVKPKDIATLLATIASLEPDDKDNAY